MQCLSVSSGHLPTAQAAFPNGPQLGPAGAQLCPAGAQLGPNWNAAWEAPHGELLFYVKKRVTFYLFCFNIFSRF